MSKIPFDIKFRPQIESGEYKVETRDGRTARVICWDRRGERPLVVLVQRLNGYDEGLFYYDNGLADGVGQEHDNDLFIVTPEPELSEFEKELESFYNHHLQVCTYDNQGTVEDSLHDGASKLLSLARKQLQPVIDAIDNHCEALCTEYEKGRADALKDLPRWVPNRFDKHNFETCKAFLNTPLYLCYQDKMIAVSELIDKLPGFKED